MKIKYRNAEKNEWLCFTHAVQRAMRGEVIEPETDDDDFSSDYDFRDTTCSDCRRSDELLYRKL